MFYVYWMEIDLFKIYKYYLFEYRNMVTQRLFSGALYLYIIYMKTDFQKENL